MNINKKISQFWLVGIRAVLILALLLQTGLALKTKAADLGVSITTLNTGRAPFDAISGAGKDVSGTDNVVRTNDFMTFKVDYSVNSSNASNTLLSIELKGDASWTSSPADCLAGSSYSGRFLTCKIGTIVSGSTFNISGFTAKIDPNAPNNQKIDAIAKLSADSSISNVSAPAINYVSAYPSWDGSINLGSQYFEYGSDGVTPGVMMEFRAYIYPTALLQYPLGTETFANAANYKIDVSGVSPNAVFRGTGNCSGSCTGSQVGGPGQDITFNRAYPTTDQGWNSIYVWTPLTDIPDTTPTSGSRTITATLKDLNLGLSQSGASNNGTGVETSLTNNSVTTTINKSLSIGAYQKRAKWTNPWWQVSTVNSAYNSEITIVNGGTMPVANSIICDVIDNTTQRLMPAEYYPSDFSYTRYYPQAYTVQYGRSGGTNIATQTCGDSDANVEGWSSAPTNNSNMMRVLIPEAKPGSSYTLTPRIEPRINYYGGPNNGLPIPSGTQLRDCQAIRLNKGSGDVWTTDNYNQYCAYNIYQTVTINQNKSGTNLTSGQSLNAYSNWPASGSTLGNAIAGQILEWDITPSIEIAVIKNSTWVAVTDTIPATMSYIPNSATKAPSSVTVNGDGTTTIVWNFQVTNVGQYTANDLTPLKYQTQVKLSAPIGNTINTVRTTSPDLVGNKEANLTINLQPNNGFVINNYTTTPNIHTGDPIEYVINYYNASLTNLNQTDIIDILPHQGDGRSPSTNYSGTAYFDSITTYNSEEVLYTKDTPWLLNSDPQHPSNQLGGFVAWCTSFSGGGCPSSALQVSAVRIKGGLFPINSSVRSAVIKLNTNGNVEGNTYTNRLGGSASDLALSVISNDSTVIVKDTTISGSVFDDTNPNNYKDQYDAAVDQYTVELYDISDVLIKTTQTNSLGKYRFNNVIPGQYKVKFVQKTGYDFVTKQTFGYNWTDDSDANATTGFSDSFGVVLDQAVLNVNAGIKVKKATIFGRVFGDVNRNGVEDSGDITYSSLNTIPSGTQISLQSPTGGNYSLAVRYDGTYSAEVNPGTYSITLVPPASYIVIPSTQNATNPYTKTVIGGENSDAGLTGIVEVAYGFGTHINGPLTGNVQAQFPNVYFEGCNMPSDYYYSYVTDPANDSIRIYGYMRSNCVFEPFGGYVIPSSFVGLTNLKIQSYNGLYTGNNISVSFVQPVYTYGTQVTTPIGNQNDAFPSIEFTGCELPWNNYSVYIYNPLTNNNYVYGYIDPSCRFFPYSGYTIPFDFVNVENLTISNYAGDLIKSDVKSNFQTSTWTFGAPNTVPTGVAGEAFPNVQFTGCNLPSYPYYVVLGQSHSNYLVSVQQNQLNKFLGGINAGARGTDPVDYVYGYITSDCLFVPNEGSTIPFGYEGLTSVQMFDTNNDYVPFIDLPTNFGAVISSSSSSSSSDSSISSTSIDSCNSSSQSNSSSQLPPVDLFPFGGFDKYIGLINASAQEATPAPSCNLSSSSSSQDSSSSSSSESSISSSSESASSLSSSNSGSESSISSSSISVLESSSSISTESISSQGISSEVSSSSSSVVSSSVSSQDSSSSSSSSCTMTPPQVTDGIIDFGIFFGSITVNASPAQGLECNSSSSSANSSSQSSSSSAGIESSSSQVSSSSLAESSSSIISSISSSSSENSSQTSSIAYIESSSQNLQSSSIDTIELSSSSVQSSSSISVNSSSTSTESISSLSSSMVSSSQVTLASSSTNTQEISSAVSSSSVASSSLQAVSSITPNTSSSQTILSSSSTQTIQNPSSQDTSTNTVTSSVATSANNSSNVLGDSNSSQTITASSAPSIITNSSSTPLPITEIGSPNMAIMTKAYDPARLANRNIVPVLPNDQLSVDDPYECGGNIHGFFVYSGSYSDVTIKIKVVNKVTGQVFNYSPGFNNLGMYEAVIDYGLVPEGDYNIEYTATSKFGAKASGDYDAFITKNCNTTKVQNIAIPNVNKQIPTQSQNSISSSSQATESDQNGKNTITQSPKTVSKSSTEVQSESQMMGEGVVIPRTGGNSKPVALTRTGGSSEIIAKNEQFFWMLRTIIIVFITIRLSFLGIGYKEID
jgi:SdrD B-like domain